MFRVGGTQSVSGVEVAGDPVLVGDALPLELRRQVEEGPPAGLRQVSLCSVLKAVQFLYCGRPGQAVQTRVDVLCIPIPVNHEGNNSEIAALYSDGGA